jgi:hypothetical protein
LDPASEGLRNSSKIDYLDKVSSPSEKTPLKEQPRDPPIRQTSPGIIHKI